MSLAYLKLFCLVRDCYPTPTGINTYRDVARGQLPLDRRLAGLRMLCRHRMEWSLWGQIRGEEDCLGRRCFPLFHCLCSKSYDPSDQVLFISICQKNEFLARWLCAVAGSGISVLRWMRKYFTQDSPKSSRGVFLLTHHQYFPGWAPHTPLLYPGSQVSRGGSRMSSSPHHTGFRECSQDLSFVESLAARIGRTMVINKFLAVSLSFKAIACKPVGFSSWC